MPCAPTTNAVHAWVPLQRPQADSLPNTLQRLTASRVLRQANRRLGIKQSGELTCMPMLLSKVSLASVSAATATPGDSRRMDLRASKLLLLPLRDCPSINSMSNCSPLLTLRMCLLDLLLLLGHWPDLQGKHVCCMSAIFCIGACAGLCRSCSTGRCNMEHAQVCCRKTCEQCKPPCVSDATAVVRASKTYHLYSLVLRTCSTTSSCAALTALPDSLSFLRLLLAAAAARASAPSSPAGQSALNLSVVVQQCDIHLSPIIMVAGLLRAEWPVLFNFH